MEVLYLLIPLSIVLAAAIALVLFLAVRSGQFEDLEGPAYRLLADEDQTEEIRKPPRDSARGDAET